MEQVFFTIYWFLTKKRKQRSTVTGNEVLMKVICNTKIYIARLMRSHRCFFKTTV